MPLRHQNFICGLDCHGIWNIQGAICRFLSYPIRILFFHGQCLQQWIRTTKLVPGKAIMLRKTRNPLHKGFINSQFKSCECFFFISIIERDISTILRVNLAVLPSILWVPWFNIKMSYYQYRKSHRGDKTVVRNFLLIRRHRHIELGPRTAQSDGGFKKLLNEQSTLSVLWDALTLMWLYCNVYTTSTSGTTVFKIRAIYHARDLQNWLGLVNSCPY